MEDLGYRLIVKLLCLLSVGLEENMLLLEITWHHLTTYSMYCSSADTEIQVL